jgi:O-antigen/teichoic acid export membrane protein
MRRLINALRRAGIFDGVWTLTASLGSKLQTLVLMSVAGAMGGVEQLGIVILSVSTGVLAASLVDLGFSTQVARSFAAGELTRKSIILRPLLAREVLLLPLALLLGFVVLVGDLERACGVRHVLSGLKRRDAIGLRGGALS